MSLTHDEEREVLTCGIPEGGKKFALAHRGTCQFCRGCWRRCKVCVNLDGTVEITFKGAPSEDDEDE